MKVFQFNTKDDQAYLFASSEVSDKCHPDPPRSLAADWVPPTFELVGSDEFRSYLPKTDFPTFTIATMVLDARAVARLRPILESCGEILPIRLSNDRDPLYLFNVTKIVNAVDMRHPGSWNCPAVRLVRASCSFSIPRSCQVNLCSSRTRKWVPAQKFLPLKRRSKR